MRIIGNALGFVDGGHRVGDNFAGRLPSLIAEAGFTDVETTGQRSTPFGTLVYLRAVR
jgi:hypothetical protein